ncbi:hypothetical protein ACFQY4_37475 [Catellatospora bangladeshensis]|uniref:Uncharacterized protein n=1 Tax=Catellatospora bangladeshensis TaxID=310355 RepID=A0A8J3JQP3_9ACTN|nr:hypothetical protein [Catellatospora bangladeshensis]GIF83325.1 hypothetical protein Cba03nite_46740 [Catellatospora bangladeshensis]
MERDGVRERRVRIRVAGNTAGPALFALRAKGYSVELSYVRAAPGEYTAEYAAEKDGRLFSADTAEELLGLVAMWEVRGDGWSASTDDERSWRDALEEAALVYDRDGDLVGEDD